MDVLRQRARALRNNATEAERALWHVLRSRQLEGFRFRRQVPIGGYIVDFVCPRARLIIELDGGQHAEQAQYDAARTAVLSALGYRVLRYWNDEVLVRLEDVADDIHRHLVSGLCPGGNARNKSKSTPPQPSPSLREREGARSNGNSNTINSNNNNSNSNSITKGTGTKGISQ